MKTQKTERRAALNTSDAVTSALHGPFVDAMERQASLAGSNLRLLQEEGLNFMTRRLEENTKAVQEFTSCKSWPEMFAAQQRWFTEMTRAYSEEWVRCSDLMNKAFNVEPSKTAEQHRREDR